MEKIIIKEQKNIHIRDSNIGDDLRGHAYLQIPLSQRKQNSKSGRMMSHWFILDKSLPPPKKKKKEQANLPTKTTQNKGQKKKKKRHTDIHFHPTNSGVPAFKVFVFASDFEF